MTDGQPLPIVVLDPGHGGGAKVGGSSPNHATGPNGLLEKNVTLDVAQRAASALTGQARVILTRTADTNLSLADRAAVARANQADVFLSIHFNGFHDPVVDGTEAWVARAAGHESVDFAQDVLRRLVAVTQRADRGARRADLGVLLPARLAPNTTACLAEVAFLTNPEQARRLEQGAYRQQLAEALATAVLDRIAGPGGVVPATGHLTATTHSPSAGSSIAPPAGSQGLAVIASTAASTEERDRRLAAAIGGHGAPAAALATVTLGYGVPGGVITQGFYRDPAEQQAVIGRRTGQHDHLGIDVSLSNAHGGGADDPRRGLPVYAAIRRRIDVAELNAVRATSNGVSATGLGIDGQGAAELQQAIADRQLWSGTHDYDYGGVAGLACRYTYTRTDGTTGTFTLYLEYLHLITPTYLPKDGDGRVISAEAWAATGKGIGFGPRIRSDARLTADQLCAGDPILVGYLGATQFPHVHIQAAFGQGEKRYLPVPRFDPAVMLRQTATTTQSLAMAAPSLALNDTSFTYDVPGTVEAHAQPSPNTCWATAATMLVSWRDQTSSPIRSICDMAGAEYRARFDADQGLAQADKPAFLGRLGLVEEPPANYPLQTYVDLMRRYGPLWVTTDVGTSGDVAIHARIMTGAHGDGSPAGSYVWLIDPADGSRHLESFQHFVQTFEQLARDVGARDPLWIQVVHNPQGS